MHRTHTLTLSSLPAPAISNSQPGHQPGVSIPSAAAHLHFAEAIDKQQSPFRLRFSESRKVPPTFQLSVPFPSTSLPPQQQSSRPQVTKVLIPAHSSTPSRPSRIPARYPSAPSLPTTALPSPILSHPLLDTSATEPFPEFVDDMPDFPDPDNTLPPGVAAAGALAAKTPPPPGFWARVLSPLLFISFLLGLYAVDTDNRRRLDSARSTGSSRGSTTSSRTSSTGDWDPRTWFRRSSSGHASETSVGARTEKTAGIPANNSRKEASEKWYWQAKKRRMAKMEIVDAMEMRGFVAAGLVVGTVLGILAAVWGLGWIAGAIRGGAWREWGVGL